MLLTAIFTTLASSAVFAGLALMSDRKRGAVIAQGILAVAGALLFLAILRDTPLFGLGPTPIAAFATGLFTAAGAGMLYHLYLGRFTQVWPARAVFTLVYLGLSVVFGLLFVSLI